MNKKKIINDPVYGFITIPFDSIHDIIEHPWFQRLTRIRQLGLTYLVYPGAIHTRFHHTLGALHLMTQAIETLKSKGHTITSAETEAACIAIMMHDIGHGPFSHALEYRLVKGVSHEELSHLFMKRFNTVFKNKFDEAITIFDGTHPKNYLHQLVSSQLDVDRLDYLNRDSFFTGVSEGVISSDRILKMLEIYNGNLVVEIKGIYSVEKFIIARRLMYWQVYLHKTVLAAENMLIKIIDRARELAESGTDLFGTEALKQFLYNEFTIRDFDSNPKLLETFASLDDYDVFTSVKAWCTHPDKLLSTLCKALVNRKLYKIEISREPFDPEFVKNLGAELAIQNGIDPKMGHFLAFTDSIQNNAYSMDSERINILLKDGQVRDIAQASDNLSITALSAPVTKYFLCSFRNG